VSVYRPSQRKQFLAKLEGGARVRAASLLAQLDVLLELRPKAKAAMIAAARRQPGWKILRAIPFFGPVRVAQILACHAHAVPLPHQAKSLAVCRPGCGDALRAPIRSSRAAGSAGGTGPRSRAV
jgi:hypothetical protein